MRTLMKMIHQVNWTYTLYGTKDGYLLLVMCGTIGLYEINIFLTAQEEINYNKLGLVFIADLAKKITYSPKSYGKRHINIDWSNVNKE